MRVLILGGYGFIGAEIARALRAAGYQVTGFGRDSALGRRLVPEIDWIEGDLRRMTRAEDWSALKGFHAVVNAAGALQDGPRDDLAAVHHHAIAACVAAAEGAGVKSFIQISAAGASPAASTAFMTTKAAGDAAVRASALDWVVFKPGLVIGAGAYGGTALLRMVAATPLATPLVAAQTRIQSVSIADVAEAVVYALRSEIPMRADYDLVEDNAHTLREIVCAFRARMGFPAARFEPDLPLVIGRFVSYFADAAGLLGWRSPLRSTAMKVLEEDVIGDPEPWRAASGRSLSSLQETMGLVGAGAQERAYAQLQLIMPVMIAALGLFWITSGAIGFFNLEAAQAHLGGVVGNNMGLILVVGGSLLDIAVGAGTLFQRTSKKAALLSAVVALFYLVIGTAISPELWLDPLGVFIKVIPAIALGLALSLLQQER